MAKYTTIQIEVDTLLQTVSEDYTPDEVYKDDDTPLHDWAMENGYVKKDEKE